MDFAREEDGRTDDAAHFGDLVHRFDRVLAPRCVQTPIGMAEPVLYVYDDNAVLIASYTICEQFVEERRCIELSH